MMPETDVPPYSVLKVAAAESRVEALEHTLPFWR